MPSGADRFFNRVNLLFVVVLFAFSALLAVSTLVDAPEYSVSRFEHTSDTLVRGKNTSRTVTTRGGWHSDTFMPVAQVSAGEPYSEIAREARFEQQTSTVTGIPAAALFYVLPVALLIMALWPLVLAVRARRWLVAGTYVVSMALACRHAWQQTWRYFPDQMSSTQVYQFAPLGVWVLFVMLALGPDKWVKDADTTFRKGRIAAGLIVLAAAGLLLSLWAGGATIETSRKNDTVRHQYKLIDPNVRGYIGYADFRLKDTDLSTVPRTPESSATWAYIGESNNGSGSGNSTHSLAGTFGLVGLVLLIGAFVGLFPFRLLVHKGRTELAYGLACGIGLAGSAALAFGIGPLVKVDLGGFKAEIGLFILALLVAITAKRKPLPPSEFVPVGVPAR